MEFLPPQVIPDPAAATWFNSVNQGTGHFEIYLFLIYKNMKYKIVFIYLYTRVGDLYGVILWYSMMFLFFSKISILSWSFFLASSLARVTWGAPDISERGSFQKYFITTQQELLYCINLGIFSPIKVYESFCNPFAASATFYGREAMKHSFILQLSKANWELSFNSPQ